MIAIYQIERVVELTGGRMHVDWRHRANIFDVQYGELALRVDHCSGIGMDTLREWLADHAIRTLMTTPADKLQGDDRDLVARAAGYDLF